MGFLWLLVQFSSVQFSLVTWNLGISIQFGVAAAVVDIYTNEVDSPYSKKRKITKTIERAFETIQLNKALVELLCKHTFLSYWESMAIQKEIMLLILTFQKSSSDNTTLWSSFKKNKSKYLCKKQFITMLVKILRHCKQCPTIRHI